MNLQERLYSADEVWELTQQADYADTHFELIEGVLYPMSPTSLVHGHMAGLFSEWISGYLRQNRIGIMTVAETGFILHHDPDGKDTVLVPVIGFIHNDKLPAELPEKYAPFAPDLAIEIISPGNTDAEMNLKVELYLRYGTRLV